MLLQYMEDAFTTNISGGLININQYNNWLSILNTRKEILKNRFRNYHGNMNSGINFLKHLLSFIDFPYCRSLSNDYQRYTYYFTYIERTLQTVFDMNTTGLIKKNMFIFPNKGIYTKEYIVPAMSTTPIKTLPLDQPWNSKWKNLKPLNLIDYNSNEYTLDVLSDQIRFRQDQPLHAVFSLDPVKLCFMFYKYMESIGFRFKVEDDSGLETYFWLHKYITTNLIDDLQDIWIRNNINSLFNYSSSLELERDEIGDEYYYDNILAYRGAQYKKAMVEIYKSIERIRNGERPDKLLSGITLTHCSLLDKINYIYNELDIMHLNQYIWQLYLRDNGWVELLVNVYGCNPNHSTTRIIARRLWSRAEHLYKTSFWRMAPDVTTRYYIQYKATQQLENYSKIKLL